ncbi:hypothetical protein GGS20DRAFT_384832 [Poronia punctata]|nr:hypothetical protein GGS20DRAFT_384832 [Poronia punctata]
MTASNPSQSQEIELLPAWVNPDLDRLMVVRKGTGDFSSWAESLVDLPAGALFARITGVTPKYGNNSDLESREKERTYSSLQVSRNLSIELNSDLLYMNHSCEPSLEIDTARMEVRVAAGRGLRKGDALTFFYPSTEAAMAQPFDCRCGSKKCLGRVRGASELPKEGLEGYYLNDYIRELLAEKNGTAKV